MKKIAKITIRHIVDHDDPIKSGQYSDTPGKNAIDLGERDGEFRYFNANCNDNPEDAQLDYEQQKRYERGEFEYIGIKAEAEILTSQDGKSWKVDTITSGGLWGVESDSGADYLAEVAGGETTELIHTLMEFGFTEAECAAAPIVTK